MTMMKSKSNSKSQYYDPKNIVLISAATALLATSSCCSAFMNAIVVQHNNPLLSIRSTSQSHPQQQHFNRNHILNNEPYHDQYQDVAFQHSIIRNGSSSSSSSSLAYSLNNFELNSSPPRRRRNSGGKSWSNRATATSSNSGTDTISTTFSSRKKESRYGVRRRVRSVLEKAKRRTGIPNNSEEFLNNHDDEESSTTSRTTTTRSLKRAATVPTTATSPKSSTTTTTHTVTDNGTVATTNGSSSATTPNANGNNNDNNPIDNANATNPTIAAARPSLKTDTTLSNVVADAASIGGLGAVVVDDEEGKIDVALDYVPAPNEETEDNNKVQEEEDMEGSDDKKNSKSKMKQFKSRPEDRLIPAQPFKPSTTATTTTTTTTNQTPKSIPEIDALKGDVSAAFSMPPPPLPFTLPKLNRQQNGLLLNGERVEFQSDMGREGSGFIAVDVKAPASVIWECLLDFYSYPETIPTVRSIQMFTNTHLKQDYYAEKEVDRKETTSVSSSTTTATTTSSNNYMYEDGTLATLKHGVPSVTRAAFTLSKFRLKIAAIHKYRTHPEGDYMIFTLDPACTNAVLQSAKGVWHTQSNPDGRGEEYTRVWLLCELKVSPFLPKWIVDYAAKKAMPRASSWIKPHCEAAAELWYSELDELKK